MCRLLGVSTSGYYAGRSRPPSARSHADHALSQRICLIHERSRAGALWAGTGCPASGPSCATRECIARASGWRACCASPGCKGAIDARGRAPRAAGRRLHPRPTSSSATSLPPLPISYGWRTSPMSRPGWASSILRSSSTPTAAASSVGRWPNMYARSWSSKRSKWPSGGVDHRTESSTTPIRGRSTPASRSVAGCGKQA